MAPLRNRTAIWLGVILTAALLLRVVALLSAIHANPDPWIDPDNYSGHAQGIAFDAHGVHWNLGAFMLMGALVKAPLYPFVLALLALLPVGFPLSAALAQVLLSTAAVGGLYVIGREVHSERAGLIASAIYAVWLPVLSTTSYLLQEQVHVPLVIGGLALLVRASARSGPRSQFAIAGGVLGLAALARSMPLYYIGPAALIYVALAQDRRQATHQALLLLLGFLFIVLPWCLYISLKLGHFILIDNMGTAALGMTYRDVRPDLHTAPPASTLDGLRLLWLAAARHPMQFWSDRVGDFQRLFRLVSWQWLEMQGPVTSRLQALFLRAVAQASDALFALSAVLAPLGVVLARRRREVVLLSLWVGLHLALLVMFAWNGVRYRAPYEPGLIVLAGVVLAGGWIRPTRLPFGLATAAAVAIAAAITVSVPEAAAGRATYGYKEWVPTAEAHQTSIVGEGGFSVFATADAISLTVSREPSLPRQFPVRLRVSLDGQEVDRVTLWPGERRLRYAWAHPTAYVELRATLADTRQPVPLLIEVAKPRRN